MKTFLNILLPILLSLSFSMFSCSDDEISPDPAAGLVKIAEGFASGGGMRVTVYSEEELFAGYNRMFVAVYDSTSGKRITDAHIRFHPLMTMPTMSHSCPVEDPSNAAIAGLFPGSILFTMPSGEMGSWTLEVNVVDNVSNSSGTAVFDITVSATTPGRMIAFTADDGQRYYLAYHFAQKPKVGSNPFEVIAFTREESTFVPATDLAMVMTPEMPSMDHGSPNNGNPVHTGGGHYAGTVNFTMTGEWRLNLELTDGTKALGSRYFDVIVP